MTDKTKNAEYQAKWYSNNKEVQQERTLLQKKKNVIRNRALADKFLEEQVCCDCGETAHLTWDYSNVKTLISRPAGVKTLQVAMESNDVVCAECLSMRQIGRRTSSNTKKSMLLEMPWGTAQARLRKDILFMLVVETGRDICYRCEKRITSVDDLSIDHKVAWIGSKSPQEMFWSLDNISFSHRRCNRPNL